MATNPKPDISVRCADCGRQYWAVTGKQAEAKCPFCHVAGNSELLKLVGLGLNSDGTGTGAGLAELLPHLAALGTPLQKRIFGPTIEEQFTQRTEHVGHAVKIAKQRSTLLTSLAELARSMGSVQAAELDVQIQAATKRRDLLHLEKETQRLESELRRSNRTQAESTSDDPRERLNRRRQEATEFLMEVEKAFQSASSDAERVIHIRLTLEEFGREIADLPIEIQKFIDKVEGQVHE